MVPGQPTQFEVPVEDLLIVEVSQTRDYLAQVAPDLRLRQGLTSLQDVGERLQHTQEVVRESKALIG